MTSCNVLRFFDSFCNRRVSSVVLRLVALCCTVMQGAAARWVSQCVAGCRRVLQSGAVCGRDAWCGLCSVLQRGCVAVCCSVVTEV